MGRVEEHNYLSCWQVRILEANKTRQAKTPVEDTSLEKESERSYYCDLTKQALFRRSKRSGLQVDPVAFNHICNKVTKLLRKAEQAYALTIHHGKHSSPDRNPYSYIRSF